VALGDVEVTSISAEYHSPRARRYSIVSKVEVFDVQSKTRIMAHTTKLNMLGCYVETVSAFPKGAKVRLRLSRGGTCVVAVGKVAYSEAKGMGIAFITIDPGGLAVLDNWIANLRNVHSQSPL
jgi:hypothetical protein